MPGVRLHHPTLSSCVFVVEVPTRPYKAPVECMPCSQAKGERIIHHVKTYHLRLDSQGDVIVSQRIVQQLKKVPGTAGLTVENEVSKPPEITLSLNGQQEVFKVAEFKPDP